MKLTLRRPLLAAAAAGAVLAGSALAVPGVGSAEAPATPTAAAGTDAVLEEYAADTWRSFAAMTVEQTGLPGILAFARVENDCHRGDEDFARGEG